MIVTASRARASRAVAVALREVMQPPSRLSVSAWADANRILTAKNCPEPGPWRTDRVPYTREIMDTLGDPMVRQVVWMAASQVAKTEVTLNFLGRQSDVDPGPILVVQPTKEFAGRWSINRLDPMLEASPALRKKWAEPRSRSSANTRLLKEFMGGHLIIVGANSPTDLAGDPIRDVLFDEIDRYKVSAGGKDGEGDPISLGEQRARNFWNRTIFKVSTPLDEATSRILPEFLASDQRYYFVACPHCDKRQRLKWKVKDDAGRQIGGIHWDKTEGATEFEPTTHHPETACYVCEHCGGVIEEKHKEAMLLGGQWRATNPRGRFPGFHISALYSPFVTFVEMVEIFLDKKGSPETLKTFINLQLGEPWKEIAGEVDPKRLEQRAEAYRAEVPSGVGVLTAAVDVQGDRLELAVWGWGDGEECWLIGHHRLHGDPLQDQVWDDLEAELKRKYKHQGGKEMRIRATFIDSGHLQKRVFRFVRRKEATRGVYACKGADGRVQESLFRAKRMNRSNVKPWTINTHFFKIILFRRLKWTTSQDMGEVGVPGILHFCRPTKTGTDAEFFAQFGAEVMELQQVGRRMVRVLVEKRLRNEAIDLYVYGLAALYSLGDVTVSRLGIMADALEPADEEEEEEEEAPKKRTTPRRKRRGWATSWKS